MVLNFLFAALPWVVAWIALGGVSAALFGLHMYRVITARSVLIGALCGPVALLAWVQAHARHVYNIENGPPIEH